MANTRSALKAARQGSKRRVRNRAARTRVRTATKAVRTSAAAEVRQNLQLAQSIIDRAAKNGVLHRRTAARHKSRLARRANALTKA